MNRRRFDPNHLAARDVLIIIPVVLGIVALFIAFAGLVSHDAYVKFGGLAIDTAALFGFFLHDSREYLRKIWFWLLTASLLAIHLAGWIILLMHVEKWGLLWFNIMVFELPVFWHVRDRPGLLD